MTFFSTTSALSLARSQKYLALSSAFFFSALMANAMEEGEDYSDRSDYHPHRIKSQPLRISQSDVFIASSSEEEGLFEMKRCCSYDTLPPTEFGLDDSDDQAYPTNNSPMSLLDVLASPREEDSSDSLGHGKWQSQEMRDLLHDLCTPLEEGNSAQKSATKYPYQAIKKKQNEPENDSQTGAQRYIKSLSPDKVSEHQFLLAQAQSLRKLRTEDPELYKEIAQHEPRKRTSLSLNLESVHTDEELELKTQRGSPKKSPHTQTHLISPRTGSPRSTSLKRPMKRSPKLSPTSAENRSSPREFFNKITRKLKRRNSSPATTKVSGQLTPTDKEENNKE